MIDLDSYPFFRDHKTTLKDASKDDHSSVNIEYMTSRELEAVNFDAAKRAYTDSLGLAKDVGTSIDAVMPFKKRILFAEFKNGKINKEVKRNIHNKIRDSLLIFLGITGKDISFSRENIDFVLVYNRDKNSAHGKDHEEVYESPSRTRIADYFTSKGGEEFVRFGIGIYERLYFRKVHTYSKEQFEEYLGPDKVSPTLGVSGGTGA